MNRDEYYIKRCLQIAKNGIGRTAPNPAVGCVIAYKDKIIGEGFTSPLGGPHAEVNALKMVSDRSLLSKSTLYVTLEPCSHHGKTPPCSDLIIEMGVREVVVGCTDPNPKVSGQGLKKLKAAGCVVRSGILEPLCREHHKRFLSFYEKQRPYIILKWAQTKSGYIAPKTKDRISPVWISNKSSRTLVHKWRTEEQAILVGSQTVKNDNPGLTARLWQGRNPIRVIVGQAKKIDTSLKIFDNSAETLIIDTTTLNSTRPVGEQICRKLFENEITSVIIEGGSKTLNTFIEEDLWDEARVFLGSIDFENGIKAPRLNGEAFRSLWIEEDQLDYYYND